MARLSPVVLVPPLAFAGLAVLFILGMQRENANELPSALIGQPAPAAPEAALPPLAPFDLAALADGEVKLVNFWASWCAPCRVEHPHLTALAAEGVPIYGINYKDDPDKARAFLAELGDPYVGVGADPDGDVAIEWGVYGVPETFVIAEDGTIVMRMAGAVTERALTDRLRPALAAAEAERP